MPYASPKTRKKVKQEIKRGSSRRGVYILAGLVLLIAVVGVGWYVYASGQNNASQSTSNPGTNGIVYAKMKTSKGDITVELYHNSAPKTVDNFVNLANSGFYTNLVWHRIVESPTPFVIQTGDPNTKNGGGDRNTWGQGGSSQAVPFESDSSLHNNVGYLGMASTGAGTGGTSQFYVNLSDNSASLDGKYAVFGKVINGLSVVNALANVPTTTQYAQGTPQPTVPTDAMLYSVTIVSSP